MAILDSGIPLNTQGTLTHPDLDDPNKIMQAVDVIYPIVHTRDDWQLETNSPKGEDGHGTKVAGLAGAETDNGIGVAGVGWNCKILPIQVSGQHGYLGQGTEIVPIALSFKAGVHYAVDYARNNPTKRVVINASMGFEAWDPALEEAVSYANANNVLIVTTAGNDYDAPIGYPGAFSLSYPNVVTVGATNGAQTGDQRAKYSQVGNALTLTAPGGGRFITIQEGENEYEEVIPESEIWGCLLDNGFGYNLPSGQGYGVGHGTSLAAPLVTGAAALILSVTPNKTPAQIRSILQQSAEDRGSPGYDIYFGAGELNVLQALLHAIPPDLSTPASGSNALPHTTLKWRKLNSPNGYYHLQIATHPSFNNIIQNVTSISDTFYTPTGLPLGTNYWRVSAFTYDNVEYWSPIWSFNIVPPINLSVPVSGSTVLPSITLRWRKMTGQSQYHIQIATDPSFNNVIRNDASLVDTFYVPTGLTQGMNYYWRVCPTNYDIVDYWSNTWSFRITPPSPVVLTQGIYKPEPTTIYPRLTWSTLNFSGITYDLYRYSCFHQDCVPVDCDLTGDMIYSGLNNEYIDMATEVGGDSCGTYHYYVRTRAQIDGSYAVSNKVYYGALYSPFKAWISEGIDNEMKVPEKTTIIGSYPNPFNPTAEIQYTIAADLQVKLLVYDVLGREVSLLVDEYQTAGYKSVNFDASNLPSGMYFYRLQAGNYIETKKMMLLK